MVLVVMMVTAVTVSGNNSLALTSNFHAQEAALLAAESGLQYAQLMLQQDASWPASTHTAKAPAASSYLYVREDQGNVVGFLETPYGWRSQFRIRFNYHDGSGDDGGLNLSDPSEDYKFKTPYVSVNNLRGASPRYVPRAVESGGVWTVTDDSTGPYQVPAYTACVIVEGRAGWGLRDSDLDNPDADAKSNRNVATRVVEAYLKVNNSDTVDAAMMAGGNILATVSDYSGKGKAQGGFQLGSADSGSPPGLRSKGNISILDPDGNAGDLVVSGEEKAKVTYGSEGTFTASYDEDQVSPDNSETDSPDFGKLTWDDVETAKERGAADIPGGTYVFDDDGNLTYYDMTYEEYAEYILSDPTDSQGRGRVVSNSWAIEGATYADGSPVGSNENISWSLQGGKPVVQVTGNINVAASANGVRDFTLTVRGGAATDLNGTSSLAQVLKGEEGEEGDDGEDGEDGHWVSQHLDEEGNLLDEAQDALATLKEDSLDATDVTFQFAPEGNQQVVFSAGEGTSADGNYNIRIEAKIKSEGQGKEGSSAAGAITASGDLHIAGAGVDLSANPNAAEGLCVYARGDVTISTLGTHDKGKNAYHYADLSLTGLVYTWGDFKVQLGEEGASSWGKFNLRGALVAYGGDPQTQNPGAAGDGNISVTADEARVQYDSAYLNSLLEAPTNVKLTRVMWATY
jgi:hypothetical protein